MDNLFENVFSIVDLDKISSKEQFDLLLSKLTNHPTPLREAVAYKLEEIFDDNFLDEKTSDIILNAITDINPNISRSICSIINDSPKLQNMLEIKIITKIKDILKEIPDVEKTKNNKNHAKNKLFFSLYWLLEALFYSLSSKYQKEVSEILHCTIQFSDYTIREKSAQLLTKFDCPDSELLNAIQNDSNFYVNFYSNLLKK